MKSRVLSTISTFYFECLKFQHPFLSCLVMSLMIATMYKLENVDNYYEYALYSLSETMTFKSTTGVTYKQNNL